MMAAWEVLWSAASCRSLSLAARCSLKLCTRRGSPVRRLFRFPALGASVVVFGVMAVLYGLLAFCKAYSDRKAQKKRVSTWPTHLTIRYSSTLMKSVAVTLPFGVKRYIALLWMASFVIGTLACRKIASSSALIKLFV